MTLFLSSCGIEISNSQNIDKSQMIKIARQHYCSLLENYPYDYCIHLLKPHFSRLSFEDKQDVAINFLIFGELDAGSAFRFMELIDPEKCQLFESINKIPLQQLKSDLDLIELEITEYLRKIKVFFPECQNFNQIVKQTFK